MVINYKSKAEVSGEQSIAVAVGHSCVAKAKKNNWLVLAERNEKWEILNIKSVKVDGVKIKENVFYKLENNEFVEVQGFFPHRNN